ncbi:heparin lyase I family protein [Paraburkholderia aromaticivorans]|uniref:heparin lyase I family protein n=1 Tax=Paraburkholderia aromaticivorans TaxID=2026199 RepID=UPI001456139F|nr:heparin lyase I family protein [Paraburkholderia aromaticivorans]
MKTGIRLAALVVLAFSTNSAFSSDVLFYTDWSNGIDKHIQCQAPNTESIKIARPADVDLPPMMQATIDKSDNYSKVANGTPRAEISFNGFVYFEQKKEYVIDWSIYIPKDYEFDSKQQELIAQIHQGPNAGYPPFGLFFSGDGQYEVHSRTLYRPDFITEFFGSASSDRGSLVHWQLRYLPDGTGEYAITELRKNGKVVFETNGLPNAYQKDDKAYLKLGLYKAQWLTDPSTVEKRTLFYGPVSIRVIN